MPSAFNKVYQFVEELYKGNHDFDADTFKWVLTNTAPVATNEVLSDLTEIANGNGYTTGGIAATFTSCEQTLGVLKVIMADTTVTSVTGNLGPFRYVVLINSSKSNKIVGWWDRGASITLDGTQGDYIVIDADAVNGILQDS